MLTERPEDVPIGGPTVALPAQTADRQIMNVKPNQIRQFETGATRDTDEGKYDYEGFLSHRVLERYAEYMHKHRKQADGNLRASDNWQKGIPRTQYVKSLWRHFLEVWALHREGLGIDRDDRREEVLEEALCAVLFNVMGFLHEVLRDR